MFSGIWQVGHGFQVSGFHYLGTGIRSSTNYGGDVRNTGSTFSGRLRPNGTIVPAQFDHSPRRRTQRACGCSSGSQLRGRVAIDGIAEVFNVFDRPNWTIGTEESTPSQYPAAYHAQYRTAQVGFRLSF